MVSRDKIIDFIDSTTGMKLGVHVNLTVRYKDIQPQPLRGRRGMQVFFPNSRFGSGRDQLSPKRFLFTLKVVHFPPFSLYRQPMVFVSSDKRGPVSIFSALDRFSLALSYVNQREQKIVLINSRSRLLLKKSWRGVI